MYAELFDYHGGAIFWKVSKGRVKAGDVAGSINEYGYIKLRVNGKNVSAHRIIYEIHYGTIPCGMDIDHINGIRNDNRIENLRAVSKSTNSLNTAKKSNNTSGVTGVMWHKQRKKWRAQFRDKYLGLFSTVEDAKAVYDAASAGFITERHGV